jgi:hypothetical protein
MYMPDGSLTKRKIESRENYDGKVTHLICTGCRWQFSIPDPYESDEAIEEIFHAYSAHACEAHRATSTDCGESSPGTGKAA